MNLGVRRNGKKRKGLSFQVLVVVPFCIALLIQGVLGVAVFVNGRIFDQMDADAYDLFSERVISDAGNLEDDMVFHWSDLGTLTEVVTADVAKTLAAHGAQASDITTGSDLAISIINDTANDLIEYTRRGEANGVYLILADANNSPDGARSSLYIRDANPKVGVEGDSDLMLAACPISVGRQLDIALDSQWTSTFQLADEQSDQSSFYYKPVQAALQYPHAKISDLGYWGRPVDLGWSGAPSITYSIPLRDASGGICGVLGVEIRLDRIAPALPYRSLDAEGNGSYLLTIANEGGAFSRTTGASPLPGVPRSYEVLDTTGASQSLYVNDESVEVALDEKNYMVVEPASGAVVDTVAAAYAVEMPLYSSTSPFAAEHWSIIGLTPAEGLFSASKSLSDSLIKSLLISALVGIVVAFLTAWLSSSRLRHLMREVRAARPEEPISFTPTGIIQVDELSEAIESLGSEVADAASRLSQILRLTNKGIGAFEHYKDTSMIKYTDGFFATFRALEIPDVDTFDLDSLTSGSLSVKEFTRFMHCCEPYIVTEDTNRYLISGFNDTTWVRLVVMPDDSRNRVYGLVEDVTHEIETRRRIEHERDHDILTGLPNRRAFEQAVTKLLATNPPTCAVMVMLDLDNLKFVNDTYGHDWGDQYIKTTGSAIRAAFRGRGFYSRVSGDEFLIFVDCCETRAAIDKLLGEFVAILAANVLCAPDGKIFKVRASMGAAYYPTDAVDFVHLREYADFAMYVAKNSRKGELSTFDRVAYEKQSYILNKKEDLNHLIEGGLVDYHFQPLVDARVGEVIGYEALMRPQLKSLPTPDHVLALASAQSKLYQIERLTFFSALEAFYQKMGTTDVALFVNSIATQRLSSDDELALVELYGGQLKHLVIEIIETDYSREMSLYKESLARRLGARLAIDDYGSGYNGETSLLDLSVDFVKLDACIVQHIDTEKDQQDIARNLISYAHDRGICVIAEGVETEAELRMVIAMGVDILQGYLLGKPAADPCDIPSETKALICAIVAEFSGKPPLA